MQRLLDLVHHEEGHRGGLVVLEIVSGGGVDKLERPSDLLHVDSGLEPAAEELRPGHAESTPSAKNTGVNIEALEQRSPLGSSSHLMPSSTAWLVRAYRSPIDILSRSTEVHVTTSGFDAAAVVEGRVEGRSSVPSSGRGVLGT